MLCSMRSWRLAAAALVLVLVAVSVHDVRSFILIAPSVFVVGSEETLLIVNPRTRPLRGEVALSNNPQLETDIPYEVQSVTLQPGEFRLLKFKLHQNFTPLIDVKVTYLGLTKVRTFRVSQRTGHIFIQTDKPVYTPKEKIVHIRFVAMSEALLPTDRVYRLQVKTPDGVLAMSHDFHNATRSMFSFDYAFPDEPAIGEWSVAVLYGDGFRQQQRASFAVEEYVLPTFSVEVDAADTLMPDMESLPVIVSARHVYGKPVRGQAMIKEFLKSAVGDPQQQQSSGNWTLLDEIGEAIFEIDLRKYQDSKLGWWPSILGKRLLIEAVVREHTTGKTEHGYTDRPIFEKNWYKVSIGLMQREIRPGYPALITARVRHPNGRPAVDVPASITVFDDTERRVANVSRRVERSDSSGLVSFIVPTEASYQQIRVQIRVGDHRSFTQVSTVLRAYHGGKSFVALNKVPPTKEFGIGERLRVEASFQPAREFSGGLAMIITAGRILDAKPLQAPYPNPVTFFVTPEMSPKTRVVAVGWTSQGNVSIDSYFIKVAKDCRHAQFEVSQAVHPVPGGNGDLEFSDMEKDTVIGLVAVDMAVYAVRNSTILSKDLIFEKMEKADRGCSDGGGGDVEESAAAAGLVLIGDNIDTSDSKNCQAHLQQRRARRSALLGSRRKDALAQKCCQLAFSRYHISRSCEERSASLIQEFKSGADLTAHCQRNFLSCCNRTGVSYLLSSTQRFEVKTDETEPFFDRGREGEAGELEDEPIPETQVRTDFRESFLFMDRVIDGDDRSRKVLFTLPHSITTWSIQTIAVNPRGGVCSKPPLLIEAFQPFFIQLDLPYKVVRNEHVQIKVSLYNYESLEVNGNLYIYGVEGVCTEARPGTRSSRHSFSIAPQSVWKMELPVFPLREGRFPIKVEAITTLNDDAVEKELYVVPEGREVKQSYSIPLDPTNTQRRKARSIDCGNSCKSHIDPVHRNQTIVIETALPEDVVEGTSQMTLAVIGEKVGPAVHTVFKDVDSMLALPKGCGEQNMMRLAPLVFTTEYMRRIGNLKKEVESRAKEHIMMAYNRQMPFQKSDGSFGAFKNRRSSLWLTAFVAKVFCRAAPLYKDAGTFSETSARALRWLLKQQDSNGYFTEIKPILHKSLLGGVKGRLALTAFTTLALEECSDYVAKSDVQTWREGLAKAKGFLAQSLDTTVDGYTAALVAYALSNTNISTQALDHMRSLMVVDRNQNSLSIKHDENSPWVIEGNGYALLASTKARNHILAQQISNWLISQQTASGAYQSTQDTVVALQALSDYFAANRDPVIDLSLHVSDGRNLKKDIRVARESATVLQTMSTSDLADSVHVHATGIGSGLLSVLFKYNTLIPIEEKCPFNVTISVRKVDTPLEWNEQKELTSDEQKAIEKLNELLRLNRFRRSLKTKIRADQLTYKLEVCVTLLSDGASSMSVVQVDMITGYTPVREDLDALVNSVTIDKFELLPDRVYLYVPEFEPRKTKCFSFRVVQEFTVINAQPAVVSAYDYYNKVGNCPIFYELLTEKRMLVECNADVDKVCRCLQNSCPSRESFDKDDKANLLTVSKGREVAAKFICSHDLVIDGHVLEYRNAQRYFFYKVNVTKSWHEKSTAVGEIITLVIGQFCDALLAPQLDYMIFAKRAASNRNFNGVVEKTYMLNEKSIIFQEKDAVDRNIKGNFDFLHNWRRYINCSKYTV